MSSSSRPAPPPGTWRIGRLVGVDVLIKPSLIVMGAVLVAIFAPRFDERSDSNAYVLAIAFVVALYVSVLLHELAHVVVARSFGMRVQSVTLHLLGGETVIEGESRTPWQELSTSIAGPLVSLLIGWGSLTVSDALNPGTAADIWWSVGWVNVVVAIFNLLPGLPLDGGRVLRAIIWQVTGREETGIRVAAWLGRLAAVAVVVVVLLIDVDRQERIIDLLVAALIAWFLWQGATDALRNASWSSRVNRLEARAIADGSVDVPADATPLPSSLRGADLLRAMAAAPADAYVVTEPDGTVLGVLTPRSVDDAYRADR